MLKITAKKSFRFVIIFLLLFSLSFVLQAQDENSIIEGNQSTIIIQRRSQIQGSAATVDVFIDGIARMSIKNSGAGVATIPNGNHVIEFKVRRRSMLVRQVNLNSEIVTYDLEFRNSAGELFLVETNRQKISNWIAWNKQTIQKKLK